MIFVLPLIPLAFLAGYRFAKKRPKPTVKRKRAITELKNREVKNFLTYDGTEQE